MKAINAVQWCCTEDVQVPRISVLACDRRDLGRGAGNSIVTIVMVCSQVQAGVGVHGGVSGSLKAKVQSGTVLLTCLF